MNKGRIEILTGTHAVNDLYQGLVPALLPLMMSERGYSYTAATGLVLAANGISSAAQPVFGIYADRRPRAWLIPLGFLVAALGLVLAVQSADYRVTWLAIALSGLGIALYHPPATVAARAAGVLSQRAMSIFAVGGTAGAACAPLLASLLVEQGLIMRMCLLAAPALVMAVIWLAAASPSPTADLLPNQPTMSSGDCVGNDWHAFALLVAIIVLWSIPYVAVMSTLALHVTRDLGATPVLGAAALTAFTLGDAAGTLFGGWLADSKGRLVAVRSGYLMMVPSLAGLIWAPSPQIAIVCAGLFGTAMFIPFSAKVTLAQDQLPQSPAMASGIALGLALSAGGLASPAFGLIADAWGLGVLLGTALAVIVLAGAMSLLLQDRWRIRDGDR